MNTSFFWKTVCAGALTGILLSISSSGGGQKTAQVKTPVHTFKQGAKVFSLAFSPDGATIAVGTANESNRKGTLELWDVQSKKPTRVLQSSTGGMSVAFSPDGKLLASVSGYWDAPNEVRLWDLRTGRLKRIFAHDRKWVFQSVAFSPDGKTVAAGSGTFDTDSTKVVMWDVKTGKLNRVLKDFTVSTGVPSIAFSPNGKLLAGGGGAWDYNASELKIWNTQTGKTQQTIITEDEEGAVADLAFSPNGKILVSVGIAIVLRDPQTANLLRVHNTKYRVDSVAFSPDGRSLVTGERSAKREGQIKLWDVKTGELQRTWQGHRGPVNSVAFSPDGKFLASASEDKTVKLWRIK